MVETTTPRRPAGTRGIVLVANDHVVEWFVAMLSSIRVTNPHLPVRVVPYDDRADRVLALLDPERDEQVWAPDDLLVLAEDIGRTVFGDRARAGLFRRLIVTESPFDTSLYIDCDAVVASPLDAFFEAVESQDRPWIFTDTSPGTVYAQAPLEAGLGNQWNTGVYFVRRLPGELAALHAAVAAGLCTASDLLPASQDQGVINWWLDRQTATSEILCHIGPFSFCWAGHAFQRSGDGYVLSKPGDGCDGLPTPVLHWAGWSRPSWRMPNAWAWLRFQRPRSMRPNELRRFAGSLAHLFRR